MLEKCEFVNPNNNNNNKRLYFNVRIEEQGFNSAGARSPTHFIGVNKPFEGIVPSCFQLKVKSL